jgi:hypothetical protein
MSPLEVWLLAAALHFAPPERHRQFPGHEETLEQARVRYASIAHDIAEAVATKFDEKSMGALTLAYAIGESDLYKDADEGPCFREGAYKTRCDGAAAAGIWQTHEYMDRSGPEPERVTVAMIFADRARSARFVVRMLSRALKSCPRLALEDRLSIFGLGHCVAGDPRVRARYELWMRVRLWQPPKDPQ